MLPLSLHISDELLQSVIATEGEPLLDDSLSEVHQADYTFSTMGDTPVAAVVVLYRRTHPVGGTVIEYLVRLNSGFGWTIGFTEPVELQDASTGAEGVFSLGGSLSNAFLRVLDENLVITHPDHGDETFEIREDFQSRLAGVTEGMGAELILTHLTGAFTEEYTLSPTLGAADFVWYTLKGLRELFANADGLYPEYAFNHQSRRVLNYICDGKSSFFNSIDPSIPSPNKA